MIAYINGILNMKFNGYIIIDVGGIGYKIFMSDKSIDSLGDIGTKVKVYTHYHVREDDISLYGFLSNNQLSMFELLISVSGVGAKSAINILSDIEPSDFALAVISNNTSKLVKIPGIGAKTAARIVLELKDKLKNQEIVNIKENNYINEEDVNEAISALQVLGYNRREIEKVLEKIEIDKLNLEDIIKVALKYLGRN